MKSSLVYHRDMESLLKDGRLHLELPEELKDSIEIVLSAYRSHRNPEGYAYLSMPLTTGKLFYDVLEKYDVLTLEELLEKDKDALYNEVILPNIETNTAIADAIANKIKKTVIAPAIFEAKKQRWPQEAYMYLWYRVLEEMIDEIIMTDHWEYSNGGVKEFVKACEIRFNFVLTPRHVDSDLPSYLPGDYLPVSGKKKETRQSLDRMVIKDQELLEVPLHKGAMLIADAAINLHKRGFGPDELLHSLFEIGGIAECYEWHKEKCSRDSIILPGEIDYQEIYEAIRKVDPDFRSCTEKL